MDRQPLIPEEDLLRAITSRVMNISTITPASSSSTGTLQFEGELRTDPDSAYAFLDEHFCKIGYTPLLREEKHGPLLLAMPGRIGTSTSRLWLASLLFVITVISTVFVGGVSANGFDMGMGIAFSAALLSILLAHELGHFVMARRMGVAASYPFFIPMPFSPIGTMGAFISMKAPPPDRRALLAIAIAGPIAGLVVAIPVLLYGLHLSVVEPLPSPPYMMEGNSLLYAAAKLVVLGKMLPYTLPDNTTVDVMLHPVAFAGWVGLLVTGLNLIPAGQLDGGHILYALVGPVMARKVTWVIVALMLVAGILWWQGWLIWAVLIFIVGRHRVTLLNELRPLTPQQQALAILGLVIFALVFTPSPLSIVQI